MERKVNMSEGRQVMVQGRIVWLAGKTPFEGAQRKGQDGRPMFDQQGKPLMQYGFGLAVKKPGPTSTPDETKNFMDMWNAIQAEALALYPSGQVPPGFSFKYKDGDGVDHNGQPFANRDGYKDHLVFALTTSVPLKFFRYEGGYVQVSEGIKCGDYVQVQVNVKGHLPKPGTQGKPGLYLNPNLTLFLGYGQEIMNTPDAASVFGAAPPPLPNGASATPVGGPANFANFANFGQQAQAPTTAAPQRPAWGGQPNPNVLPPQFQQPATQQPANWGTPQNQGFANPPMNTGGPIPPGPTAPQTAFPSNGQPPWTQGR